MDAGEFRLFYNVVSHKYTTFYFYTDFCLQQNFTRVYFKLIKFCMIWNQAI